MPGFIIDKNTDFKINSTNPEWPKLTIITNSGLFQSVSTDLFIYGVENAIRLRDQLQILIDQCKR